MPTARQFIDFRVDFVEAKNVARLPQGSQRACSHSDESHAHGMLGPIANHDICSARRTVITGSDARALLILILESMNDVAVPQRQIVIVTHAHHG